MLRIKCRIKLLTKEAQLPFDLLLLADETEEAIRKYIYKTDVYLVYLMNNIDPIGVVALYKEEEDQIEIKNIAVLERYRNLGIGSCLIEKIKEIAASEDRTEIIVGTADVGKKEIMFYERNGFVKYGVRKDFFIDNYPNPIEENGEILKDMIMLKLKMK